MSLLPRSLLWRTFALLALLAFATSAAWFLILRNSDVEPRANQIAQNVISIINLTRAALITAEPAKRRQLLIELSESEGIQVYPSESGEAIVSAPDRPVLQLVHAAVRARMGPDTGFAMVRNGLPGLWVSFRIDDDAYWVRIPRERLERRFALRWAGWGLLALASSLIAAFFIVRTIDRPLRLLAAAAGEIGKGRRPAPLPEKGPEEVAALARAFNKMSSDLSRLDEDRALVLAGVSHDLRTPLARLRLGVEMSSADEAMREGMAADIEEMDRIIGQFLDFARPDGGEAFRRLDLSTLAAEAVAHYRKLGYTIEEDLARIPELPLRPLAMRRAVSNLIDNALRHGGAPVRVATRAAADSVVFEVADRGDGIPGEHAERLKQPFTRMEAARSGDGGSGLGLAIVERIVAGHRGRLELLAREGGGLLARITLPTTKA